MTNIQESLLHEFENVSRFDMGECSETLSADELKLDFVLLLPVPRILLHV